MDDEKYSCNIMKMAYLVNFYDKPVQSKDLCICYVKDLEAVLCEEHISKSKLREFAFFHENPVLCFCHC